MEKLLYIGKSNKKFTYGKTYDYMGNFETSNHMVIKSKKRLVTLRYEHIDYFEKNFKFISDQEYDSLIRKEKLKKINKNG